MHSQQHSSPHTESSLGNIEYIRCIHPDDPRDMHDGIGRNRCEDLDNSDIAATTEIVTRSDALGDRSGEEVNDRVLQGNKLYIQAIARRSSDRRAALSQL